MITEHCDFSSTMVCVCGTKLCKLKMVSDILDHLVLKLLRILEIIGKCACVHGKVLISTRIYEVTVLVLQITAISY